MQTHRPLCLYLHGEVTGPAGQSKGFRVAQETNIIMCLLVFVHLITLFHLCVPCVDYLYACEFVSFFMVVKQM